MNDIFKYNQYMSYWIDCDYIRPRERIYIERHLKFEQIDRDRGYCVLLTGGNFSNLTMLARFLIRLKKPIRLLGGLVEGSWLFSLPSTASDRPSIYLDFDLREFNFDKPYVITSSALFIHDYSNTRNTTTVKELASRDPIYLKSFIKREKNTYLFQAHILKQDCVLGLSSLRDNS